MAVWGINSWKFPVKCLLLSLNAKKSLLYPVTHSDQPIILQQYIMSGVSETISYPKIW